MIARTMKSWEHSPVYSHQSRLYVPPLFDMDSYTNHGIGMEQCQPHPSRREDQVSISIVSVAFFIWLAEG